MDSEADEEDRWIDSLKTRINRSSFCNTVDGKEPEEEEDAKKRLPTGLPRFWED